MLEKVKKQFKLWLTPPPFEDDEEKTWRANLLNATISGYIFIIIAIMIGNLIGGKIPQEVYTTDVIMLLSLFFFRYLLFSGKVKLTGILFLVSSIILLTAAIASLGSIRTPTTTAFLFIIIIAGMLFGEKGLLISIISSSLAVYWLLRAENVGILITPNHSVNITQWVSYTMIFGLTGVLTYFSHHTTRRALLRMIKESTERKIAEEALLESEERYRILVEKNPIAIIVHNKNGEIIYANSASLQMFGATDFNAITKKHILDYIHPDYLETSKERIAQAAIGTYTTTFHENKFLRLDGEPFDVEVAGTKITYKGEPANQILIRDISERKKAEAERNEALRLLQRTIDGIPEPVMYIGLNYELKKINRSAQEELDTYHKNASVSYCYQLCHNQDAPPSSGKYPCPLEQVRATHQPATVTHEYLQDDGGIRSVEIIAAPIFDDNGNLTGFIETHRDISDRIQTDRTIRQLSRVVEQSASAIVVTDLEGNIEFTNPAFTKITGYTAEDALGQNSRILKSGEMSQEVYENMWATLIKGDVWRGELLNKKKNGELYWEWAIISPVKNNQGVTTHFVAVKDDITVRKKIELDLNESEEKFRSLVEQSKDGIILINQAGQIVEWNQGMTKITGLKRKKVLGTPLWETFYSLVVMEHRGEKMMRRMEMGIRKLLENQIWSEKQEMEERFIQLPDGQIRAMQSSVYPISTDKGFMIGIISRDITERKKIEEALLESEEKYRSVVEQSGDGIILVGQSGNIIEWNRAMSQITGLPREKMIDMPLWKAQYQLVLNERKSSVLEKKIEQGIRNFLENAELVQKREMEERPIQRTDGNIRIMQSIIYPIMAKNSTMLGVTSRDITERKKAEEELYKLAQAVNFSGSSILITNLEGKIEFVNAAFSEVSGYSANEMIGKTPRILQSGKTDSQVYAELWETLKQGKIWRGELLNRKKTGELYWDFIVISPITDKEGKITHYVAVRDDITERKKEKERLAYMATHDILTNLPNRNFFNERLDHALTLAKRNLWQVALLFIDLNDFKLINDNFGHNAGDDALIEFGKRLKESIRDSDTVARLGGDEFVCLLENIPSEEHLFRVIEKITENLEKPFYLADEHEMQLSASIGVSVFPQDAKDGSLLLGRADYAMYEAKKRKGEGCCNTIFVA